MKKGCIISILIVLIFCIIGIFAVYYIFFIPSGIAIDKSKYPITGIDISKHTGQIDFSGLAKHRIDFVFLKATEGGNYIDPKFEENYLKARAISIPTGAYHFFRFNKSGKQQADNFLRVINGKKLNLPLVLDVEEWGNFSSKAESEVITEIRAFIESVQKTTGRRVMIYTNEHGYKKYVEENFKNSDIWLCSFDQNPNVGKKWMFWQHSHKGRFDFASGWVDLNTFNGSRAEWNRYLECCE